MSQMKIPEPAHFRKYNWGMQLQAGGAGQAAPGFWREQPILEMPLALFACRGPRHYCKIAAGPASLAPL